MDIGQTVYPNYIFYETVFLYGNELSSTQGDGGTYAMSAAAVGRYKSYNCEDRMRQKPAMIHI